VRRIEKRAQEKRRIAIEMLNVDGKVLEEIWIGKWESSAFQHKDTKTLRHEDFFEVAL
jgi:hypothetical protein